MYIPAAAVDCAERAVAARPLQRMRWPRHAHPLAQPPPPPGADVGVMQVEARTLAGTATEVVVEPRETVGMTKRARG